MKERNLDLLVPLSKTFSDLVLIHIECLTITVAWFPYLFDFLVNSEIALFPFVAVVSLVPHLFPTLGSSQVPVTECTVQNQDVFT